MIDDDPIDQATGQMRQDWNERALTDAKWFINCAKLNQPEEEFDLTGLQHVRGFITDDLVLLIGDQDPRELRVLEIGCGIGRMTKHLAEVFGEVYGTDVSDEMIRQARERLAGFPNVHLLETNGRDLATLPDQYFDFAFSAYVFQHIAKKSIVLSNIREAYRVLRPGSLFKFLVSTVSNEEFLSLPKDTWVGTSLSEDDLREVAREIGAQVVAITDVGTQYTWTIFRKARGVAAASGVEPTILEVGRAEDLTNRVVETRGKGVGMLVAGLDRDRVDANNLIVEFGEWRLQPFYVGPTKGWPAGCLQVSFKVPRDHAGGVTNVRLRLPDGGVTGSKPIEVLRVERPRPWVEMVTSVIDGSLELFAHGADSRIRVHAAGLEERPESSQVRVGMGEKWVEPESVSFVSANANWLVIVGVPEGIQPGHCLLRLSVDGVESEPFQIEFKSPSPIPN